MEFNTHYVLLIKRIINTASDMRIPTDTHSHTLQKSYLSSVTHSILLSIGFLVSSKFKVGAVSSFPKKLNFLIANFVLFDSYLKVKRILVSLGFLWIFIFTINLKKILAFIFLQPWYYVCKNISILEHSHVNLDNYMKLQPSYLI